MRLIILGWLFLSSLGIAMEEKQGAESSTEEGKTSNATQSSKPLIKKQISVINSLFRKEIKAPDEKKKDERKYEEKIFRLFGELELSNLESEKKGKIHFTEASSADIYLKQLNTETKLIKTVKKLGSKNKLRADDEKRSLIYVEQPGQPVSSEEIGLENKADRISTIVKLAEKIYLVIYEDAVEINNGEGETLAILYLTEPWQKNMCFWTVYSDGSVAILQKHKEVKKEDALTCTLYYARNKNPGKNRIKK